MICDTFKEENVVVVLSCVNPDPFFNFPKRSNLNPVKIWTTCSMLLSVNRFIIHREYDIIFIKFWLFYGGSERFKSS